jgi:hypothetical protein
MPRSQLVDPQTQACLTPLGAFCGGKADDNSTISCSCIFSRGRYALERSTKNGRGLQNTIILPQATDGDLQHRPPEVRRRPHQKKGCPYKAHVEQESFAKHPPQLSGHNKSTICSVGKRDGQVRGLDDSEPILNGECAT